MFVEKFAISDKGGVLIQKKGEKGLYARMCPFSKQSCGDWCILFGEHDIVKGKVEIHLCNGLVIKLAPEDFKDNRVRKDEVKP